MILPLHNICWSSLCVQFLYLFSSPCFPLKSFFLSFCRHWWHNTRLIIRERSFSTKIQNFAPHNEPKKISILQSNPLIADRLSLIKIANEFFRNQHIYCLLMKIYNNKQIKFIIWLFLLYVCKDTVTLWNQNLLIACLFITLPVSYSK